MDRFYLTYSDIINKFLNQGLEIDIECSVLDCTTIRTQNLKNIVMVINNRRSFCCFKNNLERINEDKIFRKVCEKYNFNQYIYVITYRGIFSKAVIIKRFNYAFV